jgi:hypothetical protein
VKKRERELAARKRLMEDGILQGKHGVRIGVETSEASLVLEEQRKELDQALADAKADYQPLDDALVFIVYIALMYSFLPSSLLILTQPYV